jgi:peroxiredoxin family protein
MPEVEVHNRPPPPRGLGLVVFSGDYGRVHYALVMASAALAIGRPVVLFFTMEACRALAATGRKAGPDSPGWHDLGPDAQGQGATRQDQDFARAGIARFEELLAACRDLGAEFMACETGLKACGLSASAIRPELRVTVAGIVSFYQAARNADILFV